MNDQNWLQMSLLIFRFHKEKQPLIKPVTALLSIVVIMLTNMGIVDIYISYGLLIMYVLANRVIINVTKKGM